MYNYIKYFWNQDTSSQCHMISCCRKSHKQLSLATPGCNLGCLMNTNPDLTPMLHRYTSHGQRVGCLQRQVSPHTRAGGSAALQGVDLSQPEEAVAGEGCRGQELQNESLPRLHARRHSKYAEPYQCPHTPPSALLCAAVSRLLASRTNYKHFT